MDNRQKIILAEREAKTNLKYYDVDSMQELPPLTDAGKRYLDFLGGTKNLRVFVIPRDLPRVNFMKLFPQLIERKLFKPIYENKGISIMPDMSYAVPGFYVISYNHYFYHCDSIPESVMMRTGVILKYLRKGIEEALGIECCSLYQDDKKRISTPVHYWLVPKYAKYLDEGLDCKLMDVDFKKYLNKFNFQEQKEKMFACNRKIKKYIKDINLKAIDDKVFDYTKKGVNLLITSKCPRRCLGCYNEFYNKDLPKEVLLKFVDFLADSGVQKLTITGGDPLIRNDVFEIIKYCFEKGFEINLDTVGTILLQSDSALKKEFGEGFSWDIMRKFKSIGIPLDGSTLEIANRFRNDASEKFLDNQIKVIKKLTDKHCNVSVNTVLHKGNTDDMGNIYNILKDIPIKKWQIFQFMPVGELASRNVEKLYINDKTFNNVKKQIEDLAKDSEFEINLKSEKSRYNHYLLIDSKGYAYKRESRQNPRVVLGNIKNKNDFKKIMNEYYFLQ